MSKGEIGVDVLCCSKGNEQELVEKGCVCCVVVRTRLFRK